MNTTPMQIQHRIEFVTGPFDTGTGKLICVGHKKYCEVHLCFKAGMNIPFARILLHTSDLASDADAVFEDAVNLGNEICRRWNEAGPTFRGPVHSASGETEDWTMQQLAGAFVALDGSLWKSKKEWRAAFDLAIDQGQSQPLATITRQGGVVKMLVRGPGETLAILKDNGDPLKGWEPVAVGTFPQMLKAWTDSVVLAVLAENGAEPEPLLDRDDYAALELTGNEED